MKTLHPLCIGLLGTALAVASLGCGGASSVTANLENEERDRNRDAPSAADSSDGSEFHARLLKAASADAAEHASNRERDRIR
jgi:hypothetical protein